MADFKTQRQQFAKDPKSFIKSHMANVHMWEAHEMTSQVKMLNNILKPGRVGGKFGDSQFRKAQNSDMGEDCLKQLLAYNLPSIQAYVESYKKDPTTVPDSQLFHMEFMFTKPDKTKVPNYVGQGFRLVGASRGKTDGEITRVEAVKTNAVACIVRPSKDHPDGWEITSAFPMVTPRPSERTAETHIETVERDFQHHLHNTFTYQGASPVLQAYMDITCSGKPVDPKWRTVYTPETNTRPPMVTIVPDNKHPENTSSYPRLTLYANKQPPANANLFLGPNTKVRLGSEKSLKTLQEKAPDIAKIYDQLVQNLPDDYKPNGKPFVTKDDAAKKPMFSSKQTEHSAKQAETGQKPKQAAHRLDKRFENMADEIEKSGTEQGKINQYA